MRILVARSKWEFDTLPLDDFLRKISGAGFDASDIHLPSLKESPEETAALHHRYRLSLMALITSEGKTPEEHCRSLEERLALAARCSAGHVNCHTGRDIFTPEENITIFRAAADLARRYGLPISHETHRGRALFSLPATRDLLRTLPELRITADFSHWCCVHESLLQDQEDALALAIERSDYIHARIGHAEGPQVNDPRAPEWDTERNIHLEWWKRIAREHVKRGSERLFVCPEFGPAPYMPQLPHTRQPVTDLWEVTLYMKDLLRKALEEN
ncbi:MAG: TIM barrel protein [Bacteroidota bacterium]